MKITKALTSISTHSAVSQLAFRYAEPWRHYHTWDHIRALFHQLENAEHDGVAIDDPMMCTLFILWHDSVYDPHATPGRNETQSAELCRSEIHHLDVNVETIKNTYAVILDSSGHKIVNSILVPDASLLLDIDLSILGSDPEEFKDYCDDIRKEYYFAEEQKYREKRIEILKSFLSLRSIYKTPWAQDLWETKARENLNKEINNLLNPDKGFGYNV